VGHGVQGQPDVGGFLHEHSGEYLSLHIAYAHGIQAWRCFFEHYSCELTRSLA